MFRAISPLLPPTTNSLMIFVKDDSSDASAVFCSFGPLLAIVWRIGISDVSLFEAIVVAFDINYLF